VLALASGCSRHASDEAQDAEADASVADDGGFDAPVDAKPAVDARTLAEETVLADAGRFCGGKELPDCPLQGWMKQHAATLLAFGEISSIADAFDEMAMLAPPTTFSEGVDLYPYWRSIAVDGAAAARMGDLNAAKAACRGCHVQYLGRYHAMLRALPIPSAVADAPPPSPRTEDAGARRAHGLPPPRAPKKP
jgi:hypothetical protein